MNPRSVPAFLIRGVIASHAGSYVQAIADLTQALASDPNLPLAYQERGMVYLLAGDRERAIADYSRVLEFQPTNALAFAKRGISRQLTGDHEAAVADFSQALRFDPKILVAGWHQPLAEDVRDRTTQVLIDYLEGLRTDLPSRPTPAPPPTRPTPARNGTAVHRKAAETQVNAVPADPAATLLHKKPDETQIIFGAAEPEEEPAQQTAAEPEPAGETPERAQEDATTEHSATGEDTPTEPSPAPTTDFEMLADDAIADDVLISLDNDPTTDTAAAATEPHPAVPAAPAAPEPTPVTCPLCKVKDLPGEQLDGGRVRCKVCKAVFMPTAEKLTPAPPTKPGSVAPTKTKAKPKKRSKDDDEPRFTEKQKQVMMAAGAAAMVVLLLGYFFFPRSGGPPPPPPAMVIVSAEELFKDFSANKSAALKKYSGGFVTVTGEVADVNSKGTRVRLKTLTSGAFVEAAFNHADDMKDIQKAQKVTVRGEVESSRGNVVEISLCKVVDAPPAQ